MCAFTITPTLTTSALSVASLLLRRAPVAFLVDFSSGRAFRSHTIIPQASKTVTYYASMKTSAISFCKLLMIYTGATRSRATMPGALLFCATGFSPQAKAAEMVDGVDLSVRNIIQ